jgi:myo-inositol-1(or 4)-monophosphatase
LDSIVVEDSLAASFTDVIRDAGELALGYFRQGAKTSAEVFTKPGGSPVTEADFLVDRFLKEKLEGLVPEAAWLSEETADTDARLSNGLVLIVDPIDGTRAFVNGDATWAVAVGLVANGRPILGVIHAPALKETYAAVKGHGAFRNGQPIAVSQRPAIDAEARVSGPSRLASSLQTAGMQFTLQPKIPSLALRIARVASGDLDAAFASEHAHDWDIAAADIILQEAGGVLSGLGDGPLIYNRSDTRHGLLIAAPAQIHAQLNDAFRRLKAAELKAAAH